MHTVIGAFDDRATAERAVEQLVQAGFDRSDVHVQGSGTAGAEPTGSGAGSGQGGMLGSISHFFGNLFGDDDRAGHASLYSEAVSRGGTVVVVDAEDEASARRASALMDSLGCYDVSQRSQQWRASGAAGTQASAPARDGVLDVVQEELQVGKREVDTGGVRVVQRMSQKPVREIVKLREEHARVERHAVDRPARPEDLNNFREGTLEVREMQEVPVVAKTARVVEEVSVGKEVREHEETIEDTIRRKDVDIERIEGSGTRTNVERERAVAADPTRDPRLDKPNR